MIQLDILRIHSRTYLLDRKTILDQSDALQLVYPLNLHSPDLFRSGGIADHYNSRHPADFLQTVRGHPYLQSCWCQASMSTKKGLRCSQCRKVAGVDLTGRLGYGGKPGRWEDV